MANKFKEQFEQGFTILEALAAIAILSIGSVLLVIGGRAVVEKLIQLKEERVFLTELMLCNDILDNYSSQITVPFWEKLDIENESADSIEIPYFNGKENENLSVHCTEEGLFVKGGNDSEIYFHKLKACQISTVQVGGITKQIIFEINFHNKTYKIASPLGTYPILSLEELNE